MRRARALALLVLSLCLSQCVCRRTKSHDGASPAQSASASDAPLFASAALRCEECHGRIHGEWKESAHARAERAPLYLAMRAKLGPAENKGCDRCHAPLASMAPQLSGEGVTCDVCHAITSAEAKKQGGAFVLSLGDNVKYGPLCDAKNHYFHKMGCSPLHNESILCAGCHLWYRGEVPVFTEYEEWSNSPSAAAGVPCQGCHMAAEKGAVAVGSDPREATTFHGFVDAKGELRKRALKMTIVLSEREGKIHVECVLRNEGAGHAVPSGLPERRVILSASVLSQAGKELSRDERTFGRVLVDAAGNEAPFYAAIRVSSDTRLLPFQPRTESFDLAPPAGGAGGVVVVRVSQRDISLALANMLAVSSTEEPLLEARVPFDATKRFAAPKTVEVKR
jgi:hypothetical protein